MMASNAKGVATGTREATSAMGGKVRAAPRLTPACTCCSPALLTCFDYTVLYTLLATRSAAPTRGPSSSRASSGIGRSRTLGGACAVCRVSCVVVREEKVSHDKYGSESGYPFR